MCVKRYGNDGLKMTCSQSPAISAPFMPNSITPRKVASRKNAVSTSNASSGPAMLPTWFMKPGQLVPN